MNTYFSFPRDKANGINAISKVALNAVCLVFMFSLFTNNVWGDITIRAGGAFQFKPAPRNIDLEVGEWYKFKATAFRNPHNFPTAPDIEIDPKLGWIIFSAEGDPKKGFLQNPKDKCGVFGLFCGSTFTHSIDYKWKKPGNYTVTAKIFDEDGVERGSVKWRVQVGNVVFDAGNFKAPSAFGYPTQNMLLPNYPNPFNPETWIPYQLAKAAEVTVTIYDVKGIVVRQLALGYQPPGFYYGRGRAAHWDGKNQHSEPVASGIYFCTLKTGEFTATRKMLIRK